MVNRIADPLWLLGRQLALGELRGEDGGMPVAVDATLVSHPVTELTIGGTTRPTTAGRPWESTVEAEPDQVDLRLRLRGGELFAAILDEAGLVDAVATARVVLAWPPDAPGIDSTTSDAALIAAGRRWPDGAAVAGAYAAGKLATALALRAFLGDGNTTTGGEYKEVVSKGIAWLKDQQDPDTGLFGERTSWAASGIDVSLGASGFTLETQSLVSVLVGGVAFASPPDAPASAPLASNGQRFELFANRKAAMAQPDGVPLRVRMVFDQRSAALPPELRWTCSASMSARCAASRCARAGRAVSRSKCWPTSFRSAWAACAARSSRRRSSTSRRCRTPSADALYGATPVVAILPCGATEAHGPHLPLSTDVIISETMASAALPRLAEADVVKDMNNRLVIPDGYNDIVYDNGGFIVTGNDNMRGYYFMDNTTIAPKYTDIKSVNGTKYRMVKTFAGKTGYISSTGNEYFIE